MKLFNIWILIWVSTVFVFLPTFIHCSVANKGLVSCAVCSFSALKMLASSLLFQEVISADEIKGL